MSPFNVGDRIRAIMQLADGSWHVVDQHPATVTGITARGFTYDYGHPSPFIPRMGLSFSGQGEVYCDTGLPIHWQLDGATPTGPDSL